MTWLTDLEWLAREAKGAHDADNIPALIDAYKSLHQRLDYARLLALIEVAKAADNCAGHAHDGPYPCAICEAYRALRDTP
jgi:hypothetical protein